MTRRIRAPKNTDLDTKFQVEESVVIGGDPLTDPYLTAAKDAYAGIVASCHLIDRLLPLESVTLGEIEAAAAQSLELLRRLGVRHEQLKHQLDDYGIDVAHYPEFVLTLRLRKLGVPWARIASVLDINTAGLYKRYREAADRQLGESGTLP